MLVLSKFLDDNDKHVLTDFNVLFLSIAPGAAHTGAWWIVNNAGIEGKPFNTDSRVENDP